MKYYQHFTARFYLSLALGPALALGAGAAHAVTAGPDDADSVLEDFTPSPYVEDLSTRFTPTNGPISNYALVSNTPGGIVGVSVNAGSGQADITPVADANGVVTLVFSATDLDGTQNWTLTLTVDPVNDPPSFSTGGNQNSFEGAAEVVPAFASGSTGPADEAGQSLTFNVTGNDNPTLFAAAPAIDASGQLTYTIAADANGTATITVNASDDGGGADTAPDQTFDITAGAVNDPPSFSLAGDQNTFEGAAESVPGFASGATGPADESGQTLTFNVTGNDNPGLFAVAPAIDGAGQLTYTIAADANGTATITVNASDDGGTANGGADTAPDQTFDIVAAPVNDAPSFTKGADQTVDEDSGASAVAGWATALSVGPADEVAEPQALSFNVTVDTNPGLFAVAPAVDPSGALTFTVAPDRSGSASLSVSVRDDGGTAGGGIDTSPVQTFAINVTDVNDPPSFAAGADVAVLEDDAPQTVPGWASAISAGPSPEEAGQLLTFNITGNDNPGLFAAAPAVDPLSGDLTFTPQPDTYGTATITLNLSDDAGGTDTSPDQSFTITVADVNDAPSFAAGGDELVLEDVGAVTVPAWASAMDPGNPEESAQILTFSVTALSDPALFDVPPAVDGATGDLTYTVAADANGTATVTLVLKDDGGTANGGEDSAPPIDFDIVIEPVNDAPSFTPGATVAVPEDAGPVTVGGWASAISAGPADEAGQTLTFNVLSNSNPAMFVTQPAIDATTGALTFETTFDANGSADITINLSDDGGTANGGADTSSPDVTFSIVVSGVNDIPAPADDSATVDEDDLAGVLISVLDNDYLAETPTSLTSAGVDGYSEGEPAIVLDENDDPIGGPNGTVTIEGNQVRYVPKEDFYGVDYFTYTITDANGDTGTGTVTVTVNPVNDPPTAPAQRNYSMLENSVLNIDDVDGLLFGSYDVEGARLDGDGNPIGSDLNIQINTFPTDGVLTLDIDDGSFQYVPPVDFIGLVTFTYRVSDGAAQSELYEARVTVYEAPEPPAPPPPGEVASPWNLASVPLEQSTSVSPNVIIMMDDSGSMDWNMSVRGPDAQGGFVIDNDWIATSGEYSTSYYYLWDLPNNIFGTTSGNGRILPTEEVLDGDSDLDNNRYGVWRARSAAYNRLYYNPLVRYTPWVGQDAQNVEFGNANPSAIRLDPRDPYNTFNMLNDHDYYSDNIPRWRSNGGREDKNVNNVYIPYYYATTASAPVAWDDPHTRIEIVNDGTIYPGGPARDDCAVGDNDPLTCTYAQEIQNFANWFQYYRTREYAAKNSLGKVVADVQDIRVGYETINDNRSEPVRDMNELHTEGNKKLLMDDIYRTNSSGGTPLRRALDRAGDIYRGVHGDDPILPDPEGFCQQNFTLLFSDGYWNGSDPSQNNEDGDNDSDFDGGMYADSEHETLADVAMYFYENDLRGGMDDLVPVSQRDRLGAPSGTFSGSNARMHQHMKTYTVAFGVVGNVDPSTLPSDPTVPFAWPDPEASSQGKIDDMLHAAVNGRGQFLSAVNPQELQTALESAFLEFTQAASSTSAAAFNSTSLQEGTLLYRGFYDLRDFTGELTATQVNSDGTLEPAPVWRASEQLNPGNKQPNDRVLVTFDATNRSGIAFRDTDLTPEQQLILNADEVAYLRGSRAQEQPAGALRRRPTSNGLLGDIVNSSPVYVGPPRGLDRDQAPYPESDLYSDFIEDRENRRKLVYVGANDGILHGFDALTGEEVFGYVPNKVIDGTQTYHNDLDDFTSPFYQHDYFVDLSPRISDAYVKGSTGAASRAWNTILLGGLGAGGKGYFALNVTHPDSDFSTEANATDAVLWEFTDEDDTAPSGLTDPNGDPVKDLGYALSLPTLAMSNVGGGTENEWVAIFGNGPNSTAGVAKLFVLFPDRGLDGWDAGDFVKLDTGRGVPIAPEQMAGFPNGLGTPTLVDTDLNGTVDWVYAGDRLGNLYRFDLCDRDVMTHECSSDPDDWTVTRLFTATYFDGSVDRLQPILSQPLVMKHPHEDGFLIIFGTGSYITKEDADDEEIQSIYAIWDRGSSSPATALANSKSLRLVEQTLTNVVDDSVSPPVTRRILSKNTVDYELEQPGIPGTFGWYIDLDMPRATSTLSGAANPDASGRNPPGAQFPGEKAIRRMLLRNGAVTTTTVLPSLDEFSCYGTRPGAILLFDALSGGDVGRPVIDFNRDGEIDEGDLVDVAGEAYAGGLLFNQGDLDGALVDLSTLGGEGDNDWLFACGGNDCVPFEREPPSDSRTGRLSWRELDEIN